MKFAVGVFVLLVLVVIPFYGNAQNAWEAGLSDAQKEQYWNYYNATRKFAESQRERVEQLAAEKIRLQQEVDAVAANTSLSDFEKKKESRILEGQMKRADRQIQSAVVATNRRIDTFSNRIEKARNATQKRVDQIVRSMSQNEAAITRQVAGIESMSVASDAVEKQKAAVQARKDALDAARERLCNTSSCTYNDGCFALCHPK